MFYLLLLLGCIANIAQVTCWYQWSSMFVFVLSFCPFIGTDHELWEKKHLGLRWHFDWWVGWVQRMMYIPVDWGLDSPIWKGKFWREMGHNSVTYSIWNVALLHWCCAPAAELLDLSAASTYSRWVHVPLQRVVTWPVLKLLQSVLFTVCRLAALPCYFPTHLFLWQHMLFSCFSCILTWYLEDTVQVSEYTICFYLSHVRFLSVDEYLKLYDSQMLHYVHWSNVNLVWLYSFCCIDPKAVFFVLYFLLCTQSCLLSKWICQWLENNLCSVSKWQYK